MGQSTAQRVRRHREELRAAGLRPVQIWVPDTRRAGFDAECRRQSERAALADQADAAMLDFIDAALSDIAGRKE
jgi:Protein  of unknown function (DUF3018)